MSISNFPLAIVIIASLLIKGNHILIAIKEKNSGRIKVELLLLSLIIIIAILLIAFIRS